jgi:hypothetical protein
MSWMKDFVRLVILMFLSFHGSTAGRRLDLSIAACMQAPGLRGCVPWLCYLIV